MNASRNIVISGDSDVSSETLVVKVYFSAVFSAMKYIEPALRPHSMKRHSSRHEYERKRLWLMSRIIR